MADISRYAIVFTADPNQAINAMGKVGKEASKTANQINSSFKGIQAGPGVSNLQSNFKGLSQTAGLKNAQGMLGNLSGQIGNVAKSFGSLGGMIGSVGGTLGQFAAASGPVGIAIAAVAALVVGTISAANKIDQIAKAAKRLDLSIETFQVLNFVAGESAVEFEELSNVMKTMGNNLAEAKTGVGSTAKALQQLGMSANALLGMSAEERLVAISDRMKELNLSIEEQGALWQDIGGKTAKGNFVVFVQDLKDQMEGAKHELELMNALVSGKTGKGAEFLADMFGRMQLIMDAIGNILVSSFGPFISQFLIALQAIWAILAPIVKLVGDIAGAMLGPIINGLKLFTGYARIIATILNVIGSTLNLLLVPINTASKIFGSIFDKLQPVFTGIEKAFMGISKKIQALAEHPAIQKMIEGISGFITNILSPILKGVGWLIERLLGVFEWVIDKINWLISKLPGSGSDGGAFSNTAVKIMTSSFEKLLEDLGIKLAEATKSFNLTEFIQNINGLNAALNANKIKANQHAMGIQAQINQLKSYVGASTPKVGQQGLLQGSVEAVTVMLESMYGTHYKSLQEELNALMQEALIIEQAQLEEAKLQTAALTGIKAPITGGTFASPLELS